MSTKYGRQFIALLLTGLLAAAAHAGGARAQTVEGYDMAKLPPNMREKVRVNAGAVSILVSGSTCTCARFAEDIRHVLNDVHNPRPGGLRVVPVLGQGGLQNLKDTLFLRGINMAIVDESTLKVLKASNPRAYGSIDDKLRYVAKLYNAEFHILARKEIASIADLAGKTVNFDYKDSETDLMASRVFGTLGIEVTPAYDDQHYALKRLISGEIAAMAISTGAPQDSLTRIRAEDGLHLLPLDEDSLPGRDVATLLQDYLPAELSYDTYPNLIPAGQSVPTVASRVLLAVYNWEEDNVRFQRNAHFVRELFDRIGEFRAAARHPKWKDVNLAAEVPGWTRFKPAQSWLEQHMTGSLTTGSGNAIGAPGEQKTAFETFVEQREATTGQPLDPEEREALFAQFEKFLEERNR